MRQRPVAAAAINAAGPQPEGEKLLAVSPKIVRRRLAGAREIAHRFMSRVGRPNPGQFAGTMQTRQRNRIPTVRLDPLARSLRDQRRSDPHAVMAERPHLAIEPISRRPGFEAHVQPVVSSRQSLDRLLNRRRAVLDVAEKPDFSPPPSFCDRHCVFLFGDIESNKSFAILSHGPPSCMRLGSVRPSNPRFLPARKGGPPAQPANMTSSRSTLA